jgi:hypothetical protein
MMGACGADDDANCFDFDNWSEKRVLKWPLTEVKVLLPEQVIALLERLPTR